MILSGGPSSVFAEGAPRPPQAVFELGVPILGICYGQQVMMHCLGGHVERGHGTAEFGRAFVTPTGQQLDLLEGWFAKKVDEKYAVESMAAGCSSWARLMRWVGWGMAVLCWGLP